MASGTNYDSISGGVGRKTSVIIPSTGMRSSDRSYTLTTPQQDIESATTSGDESSPLLASAETQTGKIRSAAAKCWEVANSRQGKMVLKCSIAYFIGGLATYVTPVSKLLGHYDGKHMVATFATYFHPARSGGSMHQATVYALIALIYSSAVSVGSMALSVYFGRLGLIKLGHFLVLLIFCCGGLGFIGYVKQVMSHPTVGVACSMASIAIITILTKEGTIQLAQFGLGKVVQVSAILLMAIAISNILAFALWPSSAISDLRLLMIESMTTFSKQLSGITHNFLKGSIDDVEAGKFASIEANHRKVFGSLLKFLQESKYEHYIGGTEKQHRQETLLVESLQRLAQNIGGLRSAAHTQFSLLKEFRERETQGMANASGAVPIVRNARGESVDVNRLFTPPNPTSYLSTSSPESWVLTGISSQPIYEGSTEGFGSSPLSVFGEFIFHLGPPMRSLAFTLSSMLKDLPFGPGPHHEIDINPNFGSSLEKAISLFNEKRAESLNTLYRSQAITKSRSIEAAAAVEEVAASCGYFSYNLTFFAEEMKTFLVILAELQRLQKTEERSWEWAKFWKTIGASKKVKRTSEEDALLRTPSQENITPLQKHHTVPNVSRDAKIPFSYKVWKALRTLRQDHIKFSVKVGVGATLYALPAFIPATRPTFSLWRGEWGLVSYMVIMSMTLGQTNNSGEARVVGTMIGAVIAVIAWVAFPQNPYALSFFGWLVSLPCFWIILNWKQATFGRFILLTYNLSALYAYSISISDNDEDEDDDDEGGINPIITEIVLHRFVAVTVGVIWGLFINRMIWPISARSQLRKGLSVLWLRMALIWSQDPLNILLEGHHDNKYKNIAEENSLQKLLIRLNGFAAAAPHEFRMKGPFPIKEYQKILRLNQSILDAFHGMSVMISKDPKANRRETDILNYTKKERDELCARLSHLFYVLASSIRLAFPLPEHLPNAVGARSRLLAKLFEYRATVKGTEGEVDEDFAMVYAYVLVTARISEGLAELAETVSSIYGVLEEEMLEI